MGGIPFQRVSLLRTLHHGPDDYPSLFDSHRSVQFPVSASFLEHAPRHHNGRIITSRRGGHGDRTSEYQRKIDCALRGGDGEISPDGGLTSLIDHLEFALDQFLAVALGIAGHLSAHRERIAGPYLARETDAELAHLAGARVVGETSRETSCLPHPRPETGPPSAFLAKIVSVIS